MRGFTFLLLTAVAGIGLTAGAPKAGAQISVSIGAPPECPYGYYDAPPYACAPYGYYGPEWFNAGVFIGAGPWFHGPEHFNGHVNNHFHPDHGYKGPAPKVGEKPTRQIDAAHFKGNEVRDGKGHAVAGKR
jgi:hypothetical protein